jgi:hypothetical protein
MGRRRLGRATGPLVTAVGLALALLTAATMMPAVSARFTASTGNAGNTFTASASFCNSTMTLTAVADSETDEAAPTTNKGTSTQMRIGSAPGSLRRVYVKFALPTAPAGCTLGGATLRLSGMVSFNLVNLSVYRVTSSWTETGITWNNQPGNPTGAEIAPFTNPTDFDVLAMTQAMYNGTNDGYMVRFTDENSANNINNVYYTREAGSSNAQLVLTWI